MSFAKIILLCVVIAIFCVSIYALNWSKIISLCFGGIANFRFPSAIQHFINAKYVAFFNISLSEFPPLESYKSLNELFTRGLRKMRDFDRDENIIISPSDSLVMESGKVAQGRALQIKGFSYSVSALLGVTERDLPPNLYYANLYLSPRDYHRYHAPCDMFVESLTHFKGALLPVHKKSLNKNQNLFIRNERVVVSGRMKNGAKIYFVAVGALNVGQIVFYIEPKLQESFSGKKQEFFYKEPKFVRKGEELGMFKMGSTIVVFVENKLDSRESSGESSTQNSVLCGSILDETQRVASETKQKSGLCSHERGNKTNASIDEASGKLPDLSLKDNALGIEIFKQGEKIRFGEALFKLGAKQ